MSLFVGAGKMRQYQRKQVAVVGGHFRQFVFAEAEPVKAGFDLNRRFNALDLMFFPKGQLLLAGNYRNQVCPLEGSQAVFADSLQNVNFGIRYVRTDFFPFNAVGDEKSAAAGVFIKPFGNRFRSQSVGVVLDHRGGFRPLGQSLQKAVVFFQIVQVDF